MKVGLGIGWPAPRNASPRRELKEPEVGWLVLQPLVENDYGVFKPLTLEKHGGKRF